jgi:hypothetical protein
VHVAAAVPHRVLFHDVGCKYCYKSVCPEGHRDCLLRVAEVALSLLPGGWRDAR